MSAVAAKREREREGNIDLAYLLFGLFVLLLPQKVVVVVGFNNLLLLLLLLLIN